VDDILANAERSFGPGALATHTRVRRTRLAPEVRRGWRSGVTAAIGDGGTGEMLATILGREGSAASHVLVAAGIDPHPIRQRLAAAG
jgi:hypothetical protein